MNSHVMNEKRREKLRTEARARCERLRSQIHQLTTHRAEAEEGSRIALRLDHRLAALHRELAIADNSGWL